MSDRCCCPQYVPWLWCHPRGLAPPFSPGPTSPLPHLLACATSVAGSTGSGSRSRALFTETLTPPRPGLSGPPQEGTPVLASILTSHGVSVCPIQCPWLPSPARHVCWSLTYTPMLPTATPPSPAPVTPPGVRSHLPVSHGLCSRGFSIPVSLQLPALPSLFQAS